MIRFQIPREWRKTTEMMECQSWTIFQRLEKRWGQDHLKRPSRRTRPSHETISQSHHTRPSHKTISQDHLTRPSHKAFSQDHYTRPSHKATTQDHLTRPSQKTISQDYFTWPSHKTTKTQDKTISDVDYTAFWIHCTSLHDPNKQTNKQKEIEKLDLGSATFQILDTLAHSLYWPSRSGQVA